MTPPKKTTKERLKTWVRHILMGAWLLLAVGALTLNILYGFIEKDWWPLGRFLIGVVIASLAALVMSYLLGRAQVMGKRRHCKRTGHLMGEWVECSEVTARKINGYDTWHQDCTRCDFRRTVTQHHTVTEMGIGPDRLL